MYWNEYKTKSENKNTINEYRYFLESNFARADRFFVLIYSKQNDNVKDSKIQKVLSRDEMSSSMENTFITNPLILI